MMSTEKVKVDSFLLRSVRLFYYIGLSNRVVVYREHAPPNNTATDAYGETLHKRQLLSMLSLLRRLFKESFPPHKEASEKVEIVKPKGIQGSTLKYWNGYVDYCIKALRNNHSSALVKKLKAFRSGALSTLELTDENEIAELHSTLPVARDWDIYGALHPFSTSSYRLEPESFWEKQFSYGLQYGTERTGTLGENILAYDVLLQFHLDDVFQKEIKKHGRRAEKYFTHLGSGKASYFHLAKGKKKKSIPQRFRQRGMSKDELFSYVSYSAFVDPLQGKLIHDSSDLLFVVIPVIACGYYHFFELQIEATHVARPSENDSLRKCTERYAQTFKRNMHERIVLKESLRELLVQSRLSLFDNSVVAYINAHRNAIRTNCAKSVVKCFAKLAPLINEMRAVVVIEKNKTIIAWAHTNDKVERKPRQFKLEQVLRPWDEVLKKSVHAATLDGKRVPMTITAYDHPMKRDDYEIVSIEDLEDEGYVLELWLFRKRGAVERDTPFNYTCYSGTNEQRLREQFGRLLLRFKSLRHN